MLVEQIKGPQKVRLLWTSLPGSVIFRVDEVDYSRDDEDFSLRDFGLGTGVEISLSAHTLITKMAQKCKESGRNLCVIVDESDLLHDKQKAVIKGIGFVWTNESSGLFQTRTYIVTPDGKLMVENSENFDDYVGAAPKAFKRDFEAYLSNERRAIGQCAGKAEHIAV